MQNQGQIKTSRIIEGLYLPHEMDKTKELMEKKSKVA